MDIKELFEKYNGKLAFSINEKSIHFKKIIDIAACYNADVCYNNGVLTLKVYNMDYFYKLLHDFELYLIILEITLYND